MLPDARAIGPTSPHPIAASFPITPTPRVRSEKIGFPPDIDQSSGSDAAMPATNVP